MRVIVDKAVYESLFEFYGVNMVLHPSLDERTVSKKIVRLLDSLSVIGLMPNMFPYARLKKSWIDAGYREMIAEDFHFAFRVETDENGVDMVVVYDAVHSLLYHD